MIEDYCLPVPPRFDEETLARCKASGDYCHVLFEWYKFVAQLCLFFASIRLDSPALRRMNPIHYVVVIGLLNRCARLMLANIALSHKGLFGETTALIDRCIFESSIKASWLCSKDSDESFTRYLAEGLKPELELQTTISNAISARTANQVLKIEKRMLASIDEYVASSGLTHKQVAEAKKLPDLATMVGDLGQDRLVYIAGQRIGSHHIHGTWPSLKAHFLTETDGMLAPRDHSCETHADQYATISGFILAALTRFVSFAFSATGDVAQMHRLIDSVNQEVMSVYEEVAGQDFQEI